ncbi:MAG: adenylate/guanylate cyclase domain-containing protein [Caldimonas sp.]
MTCARCQAEIPAGARFCAACGAPVGAACPRCGSPVVLGQRFCTGCGSDVAADAGAAPAGPADEGERRQATVMFSDLSGYTALNESFDPEEVEALMARIKADASAVIERHGGTVNQFVGDEIMALFGVPLARRDDARHAVAAALELHTVVDAYLATLDPGFTNSLSMHTGIATGLVVSRRSDARAGDFALTGDAVNTAARLRSAAAPREVVVSATTWQQVADAFDAETTTPMALKGKDQPLVAYRIRGVRPAPAEGSTPLVGRDEELNDFRALAEACAQRRRSRVVIVRGDPGVGKSRLVAEFVAVARDLGFSSHAASVLDFGAETGRDAVRSLARSMLGLDIAADEDARRAAIERESAIRPLAAERLLFLHDLLGVAPPGELRALAAAMSTAAREQGSLHALCDIAASAGGAAPLLLVVEDIHWADAWTLDRLAALAGLAARQPLLLVMTTRFAGDPSAGAWRMALHGAPLIGIDLGPLTALDSHRLAGLSSTMPAALVASCVERAEGNPLFLLQLLLDVGDAAQTSLPGSIQALVHTRMDRLAADDKAALQAASVLGQRFTIEALRHLLDRAGYDNRPLVENFLVRHDGGELMFCHALIRDGAYASLLHKRRRALHARAAEWFASRDGVLAAEHFDRADDPRAAAAYLDASVALADQFRHAAALALVERGLALAAVRETRFALLMARGRLLVELGRSGDAIDAARAALEAASIPGERAQALIAMAAGMRLNDRIAEGLATLDEAEPLAIATALPLELSRLHHLRGNLLFPLGRDDDCVREHGLALRHARDAGSLQAEAAALGGLGDGYYLQGRMRSANQQFRDCVALARKHGFGKLEVANLSMIGWTAIHLTEIATSIAIGREAIELAMRASQPRAELMGRTLVAWCQGLIRGELDEAGRENAAALRLARALGARRFEAQILGVDAICALRRGDRDRARVIAAEAIAICREHGMGHIGPWLHGVNAQAESDPQARLLWLEQGERQLALGCVSHNHVQLRELAIDALLELGDGAGVERECGRIRAYTANESLPMSEFVVARGLALARFVRGERGADLLAELRRLRSAGAEQEMNTFLPSLDAAIAAFDAPATAISAP